MQLADFISSLGTIIFQFIVINENVFNTNAGGRFYFNSPYCSIQIIKKLNSRQKF